MTFRLGPKARIVAVAALAGGLLVGFQNCAGVNFQNNASYGSDAASTGVPSIFGDLPAEVLPVISHPVPVLPPPTPTETPAPTPNPAPSPAATAPPPLPVATPLACRPEAMYAGAADQPASSATSVPDVRIVFSAKKLIVLSACGNFISDRSPIQFRPLILPDEISGLYFNAVYLDGDQLYYPTSSGLYRFELSTGLSERILDGPRLKAYAGQWPRAAQVDFGQAYFPGSIYASGNYVIAATSVGLIYSNDRGKNWNYYSVYVGDHEISGGAGVTQIIPFANKLVFSTQLTLTYLRAWTPSGELTTGAAIPGAPAKAGLFVGEANGAGARLVKFTAGATIPLIFVDGPTLYALPYDEALLQAQKYYSTTDLTTWTPSSGAQSRDTRAIKNGVAWQLRIAQGIFRSSGSLANAGQAGLPAEALGAVYLQWIDDVMYVISNKRLLATRDGIQYQTLASFSSLHCIMPAIGPAMGTNGTDIYRLTRNMRVVHLADETGAVPNKANQYFNDGASIFYAFGKTLFASVGGAPFMQSIDDGATWTGPINEAAIPDSAGRLFGLNSNQSTELYQSIDGTDRRAEIAAYVATLPPSALIVSALSIGPRLVMNVYGRGLVTVENGVVIQSSPTMTHNGSVISIKLRYLDGRIYALADRLYVSEDNGGSFHEVPGAPTFASSLFKIDGRIGVVGGARISISDTSLGNFATARGCLR